MFACNKTKAQNILLDVNLNDFAVFITMIIKITSFFSSDFESVNAQHLTGKILSFDFYPKAIYF